MSEYDHEPVRGLPGALPEDEHIIWQSAPDWKHMVVSALHIRLSVLYFGLIVIWAVSRGDWNTAIAVALLGTVVTAMFTLFAWGVSRTTVYTLTNKRVVLRIGVALNKCINLPLGEIESANLKMLTDGHGNIVLALKGMPRLGYIMLWPHVRSLRFVRPQPMLRAIPNAGNVAAMLFRATQNVQAIAPLEAPQARSRDIPLMGVPA
ncbi:MAG: PH domain-containing protein [Sphingomonadaceae bacterium]|nr:PH domain-containing protein [Sphingomonadaceae bacterium]